MSWADAVAGPLAGATCLWQDLDEHTAFVAVLDWTDGGDPAAPVRTVPGSERDGRVVASRGPGSQGVGAVYEQVVVDGIGDGTGPVTFIRPVPGV